MASCVSSSWNAKYGLYKNEMLILRYGSNTTNFGVNYCNYISNYNELKSDLILKYAQIQGRENDSSSLRLVSQRFCTLKRNHRAFKQSIAHFPLWHSGLPIESRIEEVKKIYTAFKRAYSSPMSDSYLRCYYDLAFKLKYLSKSLETSDPRLAFLNQLRGNVKELHRRLSLPNPLVPQPCFATSSSAPLSSSRFNIALVPPANWEHIAHIAAEWSSCAHEKYLTIHGGNPPVFRTNDQARSDPGRMFSDSRSICDAIALKLGFHRSSVYRVERSGIMF